MKRPLRVWKVSVAPAGARSASPKAAAVANRSAGSLASARSTHASTPSGIVSRSAEGATGFSVSTFATMDCTDAPANGGSPHSIS